MEFKSHREVVLPADKAAKKRAQEVSGKQRPLVREVQIPAGGKTVTTTHSSTGSASGEQTSTKLSVRETQIRAGESKVEEAAASLTPPTPAEEPRRAPTPPTPAEEPGEAAFEPKVLNAGLKLLSQVTRRGSPGGRLIESGQVRRRDAARIEKTPRPQPSAPPAAQVEARRVQPEHVEAPSRPQPSAPPAAQVEARRVQPERVEAPSRPQPSAPPAAQVEARRVQPERVEAPSRPRPSRAAAVAEKPSATRGDVPQPEPIVVAELGRADSVWEPPESSDGEGGSGTAEKKIKGKPRRGSSHQKPYRDFIIAYDGVFIGHFRSRRRITNRTAFQQVARQLHSTMRSFDIRKLQLYRPVRVEVELPESLPDISDGAFMWFADQRSSEPGSD